MSVHSDLIARHADRATRSNRPDLPPLPRLRTLIVCCMDARVDPTHLFDLAPGKAVVLRNTGGRVIHSVIEEIAALAVMDRALTQDPSAGLDVILMQHTQCGAERLADPDLKAGLHEKLGIDVTPMAITDQATDLAKDIDRLVAAPELPDALTVSAMLYDIAKDTLSSIAASTTLAALRADTAP